MVLIPATVISCTLSAALTTKFPADSAVCLIKLPASDATLLTDEIILLACSVTFPTILANRSALLSTVTVSITSVVTS